MTAQVAIGACSAALAIIGIGIAVFSINVFRRSRAAYGRARDSWCPVEAVITSASTSSQRTLREGGDGIIRKGQTVYFPHVAFTYRVDGVDRTGNRPFLARKSAFDATEAAAWLARTPVGCTTTAFYDPASPADAALVLDQPKLFTLIYGILCGIGLIGGAIFFYVSLKA